MKKAKQRVKFTQQEDELLKEKYCNTDTRELAEKLGRSLSTIYSRARFLGLKKDAAFVAETSRKNMLNPDHPGRKHWIKKGHIPANKGKKQAEYMSAAAIERTRKTQFKKGNRVWSHKPIGYERINVYGYIEVKTAEPNVFELKHRFVWREHNGEIPRGCNVQFRDGNRQNCSIENLYIISRGEQLRNENSIHARYPEDMKKAIMMVGALKRKIREKNKE